MGQDSIQQYLAFVRDVLGVHKILTSEELQDVCPFTTNQGVLSQDQMMTSYDLVFVNKKFTSKESLFQEKTWDLFQKMKIAMKLQGKKVLEVDTEIQHRDDLLKSIHAFLKTSNVVIFQAETPRLEFELHYNFKSIECHSPYLMLTRAELKKPTWEALQKVMVQI